MKKKQENIPVVTFCHQLNTKLHRCNRIYHKFPVFSTNVSFYNLPMAKIKNSGNHGTKRYQRQRELIERVPFSRATTYRILRGQKSPTLDDLEEFARELKVPLEDLYESKYSRDHIKNLSQY